MGGPNPTAVPIIGMVGDVRDLGLDTESVPTLYELGVSNWMTLLIRSDVPSNSIAGPVRATIRVVSPDDAISRLAGLDEIIRGSIDRSRFELELLAVFAVLGGVLTGIGVFGVITYLLTQRKSEFAVRLALGAARRNICLLVLRKFAIPTSVGLVAGTWLAYLFGYVLRSRLHKVAPSDPLVLVASGLCLLAIVTLSVIRPISKAASASAASVLRES
jgi:predicted lysophospholipase L1 biosynthesis ABC-type transport system permease subunit